MNRFFRISLFIFSTAALALALGFFIQALWATALWPLQSSRLSNIFISSILAAVGAPILWIALSGDTRAQAGGALNLALTGAGAAAFSLQLYLRDRSPVLLVVSILSALAALGCVVLFLYARRFPFRDLRPTPRPVRFAFGVFAALLAFTGGSLALQRPNIFPWPISPENSVYYGWIFLGAMVYFIFGLVFPYWSNARGQLIGFLAYDLVLIAPFLQHFQTVRPDLRLNLTIYTGVLILSGAVAVYYLFIHRATRFHLAGKDTGTLPVPS